MGYTNTKDSYFNNKRIEIIKSALESNLIAIDAINNVINGNTYNIKDCLKIQFGCTWDAKLKVWKIPQSAYAELKQNFGVEITLIKHNIAENKYIITEENRDFFGL